MAMTDRVSDFDVIRRALPIRERCGAIMAALSRVEADLARVTEERNAEHIAWEGADDRAMRHLRRAEQAEARVVELENALREIARSPDTAWIGARVREALGEAK